MKKLVSKGLEYLSPDLIERNPENPRIIFDEKLMQDLLKSIDEIGILVPLIVFPDDKKNKYILLDGERRLRCAKALNLKKVPVNIVAKPSRLQNILEMFNIHNVRIEWGPMEVAWKLKIIISEVGSDKEKDLVRFTALKPAEIRKAKILLSYSKEHQNLVHSGPKYGGIKEDFLIELKPTLNWLEKNLAFSQKDNYNFINILIKKHKDGIIKNYVKNFRDLVKIVRADLPKLKVKEIIKNISTNPEYSIDNAYESSIEYSINIKELERRVKKLVKILKGFKFIKKEDENIGLLEALRELKEVIQRFVK